MWLFSLQVQWECLPPLAEGGKESTHAENMKNRKKVRECVNCIDLKRQNEELQKENENLRTERKNLKWDLENNIQVKNHAMEENNKLKQTLTEIKPILELYANSKVGEEQWDGTYKVMLSSGYVMVFDPKPAKKALQKISEMEDENYLTTK